MSSDHKRSRIVRTLTSLLPHKHSAAHCTAGDDWVSRIKSVESELCSQIEPNYSLLLHLVHAKVLSDRILSKITCTVAVSERCRILLKHSLKSDTRSRCLIDALTATDQQHVVNFIRHSGVHASECGDTWPLDAVLLTRLAINAAVLHRTLNTRCGLTSMLVAVGSISWRQRETIEACHDAVSRRRLLIDIMSRRSVADFNKFIDCLKRTKQYCVISILTRHIAAAGQVDEHWELSTGDECQLAVNMMNGMPYELVEQLVVRSVIALYTSLRKSSVQADLSALVTVCSVCVLWHRVVASRRWIRRQIRCVIAEFAAPFHRTPRYLSCMKTQTETRGVALLDDTVYLISAGSHTVLLYQASPPFTHRTSITLPTMSDPRDIVACPVSRRLYIADLAGFCLWRMSASGNDPEQLCPEEFQAKQAGPYSMSISPQNRILVLLHSANSKFLLSGVDTDETVLVCLPEFMNPQHAVETPRGTFIVCHTGSRRSDVVHDQVTEVGSDSSVLATYGCYCGDGLNQLSGPSYMSLFPGGRVLVCDTYNHRIVVLGAGLKLERVLLAWGDGSDVYPHRVCVAADTGRLYVADYNHSAAVYRAVKLDIDASQSC